MLSCVADRTQIARPTNLRAGVGIDDGRLDLAKVRQFARQQRRVALLATRM